MRCPSAVPQPCSAAGSRRRLGPAAPSSRMRSACGRTLDGGCSRSSSVAKVAAALQLVGLAVVLGFLGYATATSGTTPPASATRACSTSASRSRSSPLLPMFVEGWRWILRSYSIRVPYRIALRRCSRCSRSTSRAGSGHRPHAVLAIRRPGVKDTRTVLASVLLEAGLSAVAGIFVFLVASRRSPTWTRRSYRSSASGCSSSCCSSRLCSSASPDSSSVPSGHLTYPSFPSGRSLACSRTTPCRGWSGRRPLLPPPCRRRRHVADRDSLSRRRERGRGDRRRALDHRAVGLGVREASSMYGLVSRSPPRSRARRHRLERIAITAVEAALLLAAVIAWRMRVDARELEDFRARRRVAPSCPASYSPARSRSAARRRRGSCERASRSPRRAARSRRARASRSGTKGSRARGSGRGCGGWLFRGAPARAGRVTAVGDDSSAFRRECVESPQQPAACGAPAAGEPHVVDDQHRVEGAKRLVEVGKAERARVTNAAPSRSRRGLVDRTTSRPFSWRASATRPDRSRCRWHGRARTSARFSVRSHERGEVVRLGLLRRRSRRRAP